jgi:hypothetical protein
MKRLLPHISSVVLVTVGVLIGSVLTGNNAIAQKLAALTGSGTPGQLAKWTSQTAIGNSTVSEDKNGLVSVASGIKFPDGSIQTTGEGVSNHHQELTFVVSPQEQLTVPLPKLDRPVRVEVGIAPTQARPCPTCPVRPSGPIIMSGVYYYDTALAQVVVARVVLPFSGADFCSLQPSDVCGVLSTIQAMPVIVVGLYDPSVVVSPSVRYSVSLWY